MISDHESKEIVVFISTPISFMRTLYLSDSAQTPPSLRPDYISDFSELRAREVRYVLVVGFVFVFRSRLDTIK